MAKRFEFGIEWQLSLLAMSLRKRGFYARHRTCLSPQWFTSPVLANAMQAVEDLYELYGQPPTPAGLVESLMESARRNKMHARLADDYAGLAARITEADLSDDSQISDMVVAFAKRSAIEAELIRVIQDIQAGNIDNVAERIAKAEQSVQARQDLGSDYWLDDTRFQYSRNGLTTPTGLAKLDQFLGGGLAVKELGIVAAPTNGFKSGLLVNFGAAALRRRTHVAYASLELGATAVIGRFDRCLFGQATLHPDPPEWLRQQLADGRNRFKSELSIRRWAPGTCRPTDLQQWCHALRDAGRWGAGQASLLIVDYAALMAAPKGGQDEHVNIRRNYQSLLRLADEFSCPVWTAIQIGRDGSAQMAADALPNPTPGFTPIGKTLHLKDVAGAYDVASDADVVLTLNSTVAEKTAGQMRIYLAKSRETEGGKMIFTTVDPALMRVREKIQSVEQLQRRDNGSTADAPADKPRARKRITPFQRYKEQGK